MPANLDGRLVVAISSRALFDFEEENRIFEAGDDRAYMQLQLQRVEEPAPPGVAFSLVNKLLAFNATAGDRQRVEVVILSRNDPVSGMRVFRSAQHYGLPIERGVFTRGEPPWRYLRPLAANLFLSTNEADVRQALAAGVPAARVYPHSARASAAHPDAVRIAFDGDAVLFKATNVTAPPRRWPPALSSRCWKPCTACSVNPLSACACAPRSSPRAAHRRTSAPYAR